jgi:hypothetical protein
MTTNVRDERRIGSLHFLSLQTLASQCRIQWTDSRICPRATCGPTIPQAALKIPVATTPLVKTGANKGIGFEVARQIGRRGALVLVRARNKPAGEKAAASLAAEQIDAHFVAIDVADYASIEAAARTISSKFGRLGILVNNAGINDPRDGPATTAQLDAVERVLRTNFLGALR